MRWAQCSVLMPMVQFSLAPWRVLDPEHLRAVGDAVALRQRLLPEILALVAHAAATGEPVVRPLAYHHPGFEQVSDEFLLGEDLLVRAGARGRGASRHVVFPPGCWEAADGTVVDGPAELDVPSTWARSRGGAGSPDAGRPDPGRRAAEPSSRCLMNGPGVIAAGTVCA